MTMCVTPAARARASWWVRKGTPAAGTIGLGVCTVNGRSLVPLPPTRRIASVTLSSLLPAGVGARPTRVGKQDFAPGPARIGAGQAQLPGRQGRKGLQGALGGVGVGEGPQQGDAGGVVVEAEGVRAHHGLADAARAAFVDDAAFVDEEVVADVFPA